MEPDRVTASDQVCRSRPRRSRAPWSSSLRPASSRRSSGLSGVRAVRPRADPCGLGGGDVLQRRPPADHASRRTRRGPRSLIVTSDRGLAGAYSSSVLKEAERLAEKLRGEGKEVVTYLVGRKARGVLPVPPASESRAVVDGLLRPARRYDVRQGDRRRTLIEAFIAERTTRAASTRSTWSTPASVDADPGARGRPAAAARGRRGRGDAGAGRGAAALRVRAGGRAGARRAAAAVRPEPDLHRAAAGGGLRAGRPPEGDEVGDATTPRSSSRSTPARQPGPPGRDHPGDQRDRRRRQRAAPTPTPEESEET